ncbi:phasin family protein [Sphingomonas pseudosanguinis]|uniref:Phasin family protein n=1 Tax=Sphingomonas pseudosanguinis TaxID=413712 RepID=A0A7W6F1Y1_9SPHN|nr:phasin family protein [Sphingomonas pseudosanguinis]MBB3878414.1 phasin family protein [Sphingomonas pseudosanguinis]MBN3538280.1 phasin family protein [Sphingomonas pseudosanguinis]
MGEETETMAEDMGNGGGAGAIGGDMGAGAFSDRLKGAGEAMQASGQKMAEGGSAVTLKMLEQAETNTREAFAAMRQAASARDLSDVMRIQSDFIREQGNRSMSQVREIGEMIVQFGRDAVGTARGEK